MGMLASDLWILGSCVIHRGGAVQWKRLVRADPPLKCFASDDSPLSVVHVGQLCRECQRYSGEDALGGEDAPAKKDAEGEEEVDADGTQKIVEEDVCGFAAVLMISLDQTVLYTTHRPGPLAVEVSAGPVIDMFPTRRP